MSLMSLERESSLQAGIQAALLGKDPLGGGEGAGGCQGVPAVSTLSFFQVERDLPPELALPQAGGGVEPSSGALPAILTPTPSLLPLQHSSYRLQTWQILCCEGLP